MRHRLQTWSVVVLLAGAGLTLAQLPVAGQSDDLDALSPATLDRDLQAELDDIYESLPPDRLDSLDDLMDHIIDALSDEGDDRTEQDIDEENLEAEMEEAGTSLEDVVEAALQQADLLAAGPRSLTWTVVRVASLGQRGDGMTTPRLAVAQVKGRLIQTIRSRR
jgi:hypothetical protein